METLYLIIQIVGGLFTAGAAALGFAKAFRAWKKCRDNARHLATLEAIRDISHNLNKILWHTPADRVMLLRAENGGGFPTPGHNRYSSVLLEVFDSKLDSVRDLWQRVQLDQHYNDILIALYTDGGCRVDAAKMPPDALLYPIYQEGGVKVAYAFMVGATDKEMYYLVMNLTSDEHLEGAAMSLTRQSLAQITEALARFENFVHTPPTFPIHAVQEETE